MPLFLPRNLNIGLRKRVSWRLTKIQCRLKEEKYIILNETQNFSQKSFKIIKIINVV